MFVLDGARGQIILMREGSVAPCVTTAQILLRRHRPHADIKADGIFGPKTKAAVKKFQEHHRLDKDGVVGGNTWRAFAEVSGLKTIDVVDGTDSALVEMEAADIRTAGGDPIVVYGMSNGVEYVMGRIRAAAGGAQSVALLRIHEHGARGTQNVTGGTINGAPHMAAISDANFSQLAGTLATIRGVFVDFASVQLLGCSVGGGNSGRSLVNKLAQVWGVPVTAGVFDQLGGGAATFKFEGPVVTGFPGGGELPDWSGRVEASSGNVTMAT